MRDTITDSADSVFAVSWNRRSGDTVASGGADDRAFLWRVSGTAAPNARLITRLHVR